MGRDPQLAVVQLGANGDVLDGRQRRRGGRRFDAFDDLLAPAGDAIEAEAEGQGAEASPYTLRLFDGLRTQGEPEEGNEIRVGVPISWACRTLSPPKYEEGLSADC